MAEARSLSREKQDPHVVYMIRLLGQVKVLSKWTSRLIKLSYLPVLYLIALSYLRQGEGVIWAELTLVGGLALLAMQTELWVLISRFGARADGWLSLLHDADESQLEAQKGRVWPLRFTLVMASLSVLSLSAGLAIQGLFWQALAFLAWAVVLGVMCAILILDHTEAQRKMHWYLSLSTASKTPAAVGLSGNMSDTLAGTDTRMAVEGESRPDENISAIKVKAAHLA